MERDEARPTVERVVKDIYFCLEGLDTVILDKHLLLVVRIPAPSWRLLRYRVALIQHHRVVNVHGTIALDAVHRPSKNSSQIVTRDDAKISVAVFGRWLVQETRGVDCIVCAKTAK